MRAMVLRGKQLVVDEIAQPQPGPGQVLARVRACGICGSDLHILQAAERSGGRPDDLVMGHEFVAEVAAAGPGTEAWAPGTRVVCSPTVPVPGVTDGLGGLAGADGRPPDVNYFLYGRSQTVGYAPQLGGGYGEYVVLSAPLLVKVPDHVPDRIAATTEPCAVGLHAVRSARVRPDESVLVLGAGPIGLMTLLWLKRDGVNTVAVSEPAAPRRELAARLGADYVLDRAQGDVAGQFAAAVGGPPRVVFDCVGAPGTMQQAMELAAPEGRVIIVGVCGMDDTVRPSTGIVKHLAMQFVLGYTAAEVAEALGAIADGSIDTAPLVTRTVSLDELPAAFRSLNDPHDCKVLLEFA